MCLSIMEIFQIIITVGTIVSIIIVWWFSYKQLREIKNQTWVSIYSDYTRRYSEITSKFPENINEEEFVIKSGTEGYNNLMRAMRLYFDLCYEEYSLFNNYKKIDEELWENWKEGMEAALSKKAFKDAWNIINKDTVNSDSFDKFIQNIIDKKSVKGSALDTGQAG